MKRITALALALAACNQKAAEKEANQGSSRTSAQAPVPVAKPFSVELETDLIEFDFSLPAEASAIPELADQLRREMEQVKSQSLADAQESKANSQRLGFPFRPHMHSTVYETAGETRRLLSLRSDDSADTGGAHGNYGTSGLLWDRQAKREIKFVDLFTAPANRDRLLTQRWCDALNKAREEKRGEPVGGGGMFDDCPALDDIAIIPADSNKDGRFDKLLLIASPYVAGPWVEGSYEIELAATADLVAGLKDEFQPSFAAQRPQ